MLTALPVSEWHVANAVARGTFRDAVCVVPNVTRFGGEIDVLVVKPNLKIIDVEVKISRSDLRADSKKDKWWQHPQGSWDAAMGRYVRPEAVRRDWPRATWKHYYALPESVWCDDLFSAIAATSGVLLVTATGAVRCCRHAKPNPQAQPMSVHNFVAVARLATLRMWDLRIRGGLVSETAA